MPFYKCGQAADKPEPGTCICIGSVNGKNSGKAVKITQGGRYSIYAYGKRYGLYDPDVSISVNGVRKWTWHPSDDGIEEKSGSIVLEEDDLVSCSSSSSSNIGMMNCAIICYKTIE